VVGEGRKFLGGLIQIDFDSVGRWAAERGLDLHHLQVAHADG
jgi:long-chain acyl-CoA synthetase